MIPLCLEEGVGLIPWSPLARGFLAGNRNSESRGETVRAKTDDFAQKLYYRPSDFTVVDRSDGNREKARSTECAGCLGLDSVETRSEFTHHRRQQDGASGSGDRGAGRSTWMRRNQGAGRALRAAPRFRILTRGAGRTGRVRQAEPLLCIRARLQSCRKHLNQHKAKVFSPDPIRLTPPASADQTAAPAYIAIAQFSSKPPLTPSWGMVRP